jgi:hypothetical protein
MTAATIQGPGGFSVSHTAGGTSSAATGCNKINNWSVQFSLEKVPTTGWVDAGNRVYEVVSIGADYQVGGVAQSGTGIGPIPIGLANAAPTFSSATTTATFTASSGCTISFSALLTGVSVGRSVAGDTGLIETGISRGPITMAWG